MYSFDIQNIPGKGRSAIATKPFSTGDTIFEEEPFVSSQFSWNAAYGYAACDFCMRPLETTIQNVRRLANNNTLVVPFPECDPTTPWQNQFTQCPRCKVQYCSEDCQKEAFNRYHRMSCLGPFRLDDTVPINILNETWKKMHYPPETGSIKLIMRILAMYQQSNNKSEFIESLQAFQSLSVSADQQIYHKMLGENFDQQMKQLYAAFCAAYPDEEFAVFTTPDAFKSLMALIGTNSQGVATSPLAEWVRRVSDLPLPNEEKAKLDECIDELYNKVGEFAGEFLNNEGAALYTLQSKVNHSCIPNAQSTFPYSNDIVVLKALKPIAIGEEICISYLDECQLERSRHTRQKILKENYIFVCECPRCQAQAADPDETSEDDDDDDDDMETGDDDVNDDEMAD